MNRRTQKAQFKQKQFNISVQKSQIRTRNSSTKVKKTSQENNLINTSNFYEEVDMSRGFFTNFKKVKLHLSDKEVFDFYQDYTKSFLDLPQMSWKKDKFTNSDFEFIDKHKSKLAHLFSMFKQKGGFKEVIANDQIEIIREILDWDNQSANSLRELYEKYLYHYERFSDQPPIHSQKLLKSLNPSLLHSAPTFPLAHKRDLTSELLQDAITKDVAILRNFEKVVCFNSNLFSPSTLKQEHPNYLVDVITQNPEALSFTNLEGDKLYRQLKRQERLEDFINYQQSFQYDPDTPTDFCVNIDIGKWDSQMKELKSKIPPQLFCLSEFDILRHCPIRILGVTDPQMYLKVKGNWTGGHQENLRVRAVNINHGPGSSVWYCIENKHVKSFRKKVKQQHKLDIFSKEGQWFADIDWCLSNGIEVIVFNQRPGDLVILGPGTQHWVRSLGISSQTAWNFCTSDYFQLEQMYERFLINKKIKFRTIIPLTTLFMQTALKELNKLDTKSLLFLHKVLQELFSQYQQQREKYGEKLKKFCKIQKIKDKKFVKVPQNYPALLCDLCGSEIFQSFIFSDQLINLTQWLCCECGFPVLKGEKGKIGVTQFHYRYEKKELDQVLNKIDKEIVNKGQLSESGGNNDSQDGKGRKRVKKGVNWVDQQQPISQTKVNIQEECKDTGAAENLTNQEMTPLLEEEEVKDDDNIEQIIDQYEDLEFSQKELTKPQNLQDLIPKRPKRESSIFDQCIPEDPLKKLVPVQSKFSKGSSHAQDDIEALIEEQQIKNAFHQAKRVLGNPNERHQKNKLIDSLSTILNNKQTQLNLIQQKGLKDTLNEIKGKKLIEGKKDVLVIDQMIKMLNYEVF